MEAMLKSVTLVIGVVLGELQPSLPLYDKSKCTFDGLEWGKPYGTSIKYTVRLIFKVSKWLYNSFLPMLDITISSALDISTSITQAHDENILRLFAFFLKALTYQILSITSEMSTLRLWQNT